MKDFNSKERRRLLRQLKASSDTTISSFVKKVEIESQRIAEENRIFEIDNHGKKQSKSKRKREHNENKSGGIHEENAEGGHKHDENENIDCREKKKKEWFDLPPEERERREQQRQRQIEVARQRAAGEIDMSRHPLNSERRRANRRKPGRMGKIAAMVRAKKERKKDQRELAQFNANGYMMRKFHKPNDV